MTDQDKTKEELLHELQQLREQCDEISKDYLIDSAAHQKAVSDLLEARNTLEQKVLERTHELIKSKKLLDETARMAVVGGWEVDLLTGKNYWSDITRTIHEVSPDFDPNLDTAIHFYAPESLSVVTGLVNTLINTGEPFDAELELITAKKNRIWVRAIGEAYRENGVIVRIGGVFQNINERKLAEFELIKYRDHLEELIKERTRKIELQFSVLTALINSPIDTIIFSLDRSYCYTTFNEMHRQEMKKIWQADIKIGSSLLDYMTIPELRDLAKQSIDKVLAGEVLSEIQHQVDAAIYYEFSWNPVFQNDEVVGATVFIRNITERKTDERILKDNLSLMCISGVLAKLGGWSVNLAENRSYWSDEVAAIHEMPAGYSPLVEEGINFYAPEWRERITKVFTECAEYGTPYNEEMEIITSTGKRVWIQTIGEAIRNEEGKIFKVHGAFQNITEQKQARKRIISQLEELQRWQKVTLGREDRNRQLKREVNELLLRLGEKIRYPSQEGEIQSAELNQKIQ